MSDRAQRYFLWIFAALLVAGTGLALRYAKNYREQAASFVPGAGAGLLPGGVDLRFQNVRVVGRKNNQRAWTLQAGRVDTTKNYNRVEFAENIKAILWQNNTPRARFSAPFATYDTQGQSLSAYGKLSADVWSASQKMNSVPPFHLEAGRLFWGVGTNTLRCEGAVRATAPGANITGDNLTVNLQTRDYTLQNLNARFTIGADGTAPAIPDLPEGVTP